MFKTIGVRGNLLLSFIGISGFAVLTTVAAIYSFLVFQTLLDRITEQRMPVSLAAQELSYRVERSLARTPALLSATLPDERSQSWERISFEIRLRRILWIMAFMTGILRAPPGRFPGRNR